MKLYGVSFEIEVDEHDYPSEETVKQAVDAALDPVGIVIRTKVNGVPF